MRVLKIGPPRPEPKSLDLREIGWTYRVSDEARAQIKADERRARRVLETAHLYWFGA